MEMDIGAKVRKTYQGTEVVVYRKNALCGAAELAVRMIERWGVVAFEPDGEDSVGRQKARMLSESDVVQRACLLAEAAFTEFEKRGWLLNLPEPEVEEEK
jgi:hypothetical protein